MELNYTTCSAGDNGRYKHKLFYGTTFLAEESRSKVISLYLESFYFQDYWYLFVELPVPVQQKHMKSTRTFFDDVVMDRFLALHVEATWFINEMFSTLQTTEHQVFHMLIFTRADNVLSLSNKKIY